jgi:hypothetical protein
VASPDPGHDIMMGKNPKSRPEKNFSKEPTDNIHPLAGFSTDPDTDITGSIFLLIRHFLFPLFDYFSGFWMGQVIEFHPANPPNMTDS